jgi:membrane associated rhomboid family serine protease
LESQDGEVRGLAGASMLLGGKEMDYTTGDVARLGFWFAVAAWVTWNILSFCRKFLELAVLATVMGMARLVLWMRPRFPNTRFRRPD